MLQPQGQFDIGGDDMGSQIEFNIDEMRAHQKRLDGLSTRASDSSTTAQGLSQGAGFELYGLMCSPILVPILQIAEAANTGALDALAQVMQGRHDAFNDTANAYETTEDDAKQIAEDAVGSADV